MHNHPLIYDWVGKHVNEYIYSGYKNSVISSCFSFRSFLQKNVEKKGFSYFTQILYHSINGKRLSWQLTQRKQNYTSILLLSFSSRRMTCKLERVKMMKREMWEDSREVLRFFKWIQISTLQNFILGNWNKLQTWLQSLNW